MISVVNDGQPHQCGLCRTVTGAVLILESGDNEIAICYSCLVTSLNRLSKEIGSISELYAKQGIPRK